MDTGASNSGYMQLSVIGALQVYTLNRLEGPKRLYVEHVDNGYQNSWYTHLLVRRTLKIHKLLIKKPPLGIHRMCIQGSKTLRVYATICYRVPENIHNL